MVARAHTTSGPEPGSKLAVLLVGHGAVPADCPRDLVHELKTLEAQRKAAGTAEPTHREQALERQVRQWPRTPETDPYQAGLEHLARHLRAHLNGIPLAVAYYEFCAPAPEEAIDRLVAEGAQRIIVIPSMMIPGGVHSEKDIPALLARARARHPGLDIRYGWPFDMAEVARFMAAHLARFW